MVISGKNENGAPDMGANNVKMVKQTGPEIDTVGKNRKTNRRAKIAQLAMVK